MTSQNQDINTLKTDVAVIKATQITYVSDFKDFKTEVKENQKAIIETMDKFAFTPKSDHNELKLDFESFKSEIETNYRKKTDGQTIRNIGVAVMTAIAISFATIVFTFIINGGLGRGQ